MAQDDYYYEIQLTNKQLVFYFMAGATGLILSFLAGVMVGRGVDSVAGEVQAARTVQEDRIVAEETPKPARPATEDLTYAQRLEGEKVDDTLERPKAGVGKVLKPAPVVGKAAPPPKTAPVPKTAPPEIPVTKVGPGSPLGATAAAKPAPPASSPAAGAPAPTRIVSALPSPAAPAGAETGGGFTIQVGVFKEKGRADAIVSRLKSKGFAAHVTGGAEGPFSVRVGSYADRAAAERDQARLRDEEKLQPFIVKK